LSTTSSHAGDVRLQAHGDTQAHGSRRGYLTGFVLAVILTVIPFWLVMGGVLENATITALLIFACAILQILVHVVCFLHLDTRAEGGWSLISFMFTIVIVGILISGSVWIMYHLNTNLMPVNAQDPSQVP
jgi:cytochrome o ubiquinol oxidase operon protein cyoD